MILSWQLITINSLPLKYFRPLHLRRGFFISPRLCVFAVKPFVLHAFNREGARARGNPLLAWLSQILLFLIVQNPFHSLTFAQFVLKDAKRQFPSIGSYY